MQLDIDIMEMSERSLPKQFQECARKAIRAKIYIEDEIKKNMDASVRRRHLRVIL